MKIGLKENYELIIIGAGPAGLAAALSARSENCSDMLIIERDDRAGGILNQCIHNGFGLHTFKEELTGPEYAGLYEEQVLKEEIPILFQTMVVKISSSKEVTILNKQFGLRQLNAKSIILAMGCRERPRGALNIPGTRPAGIYSAGTAQRLINVEGRFIGKEVVILGSGDIGLIMARRMLLEGATVKAVAEILPFSSGLKRNVVQCLEDFHIPLRLSHTVTMIHGKKRITGVTLSKVDQHLLPIFHTQEYVPCDTLLLSVGLIPENELSKQCGILLDPLTNGPFVQEDCSTSIPGIFACGNVLHVHDVVDDVSIEATTAGSAAARYLKNASNSSTISLNTTRLPILPKEGIRYVVPQQLNLSTLEHSVKLRCRSDKVYQNCYLVLLADEQILLTQYKPIITPGEMLSLELNEKLLSLIPFSAILSIQIRSKDLLEVIR